MRASKDVTWRCAGCGKYFDDYLKKDKVVEKPANLMEAVANTLRDEIIETFCESCAKKKGLK